MRILRLTTGYPQFEAMLARKQGLDTLSYAAGFRLLADSLFWYADWGEVRLRELGHDAEMIYVSFEPTQRAWARENGVAWSQASWRRDVAAAQVKAFRPDVLFLEDLYLVDRGFRDHLRAVGPPGMIVSGWRAAPTDDFAAFKDLDLVLTCSPNFLTALRAAGARVELLPHAFETTLVEKVAVPARDLPLTFLGSVGVPGGSHAQRFATLAGVVAATNLQVWSDLVRTGTRTRKGRTLLAAVCAADAALGTLGVAPERRARLKGVNLGLMKRILRAEPGRFHEPVFGREYLEVLARSRITFNQHIDCAEDFAVNLRLYEATGMGACLVTDWKKNLGELFELDREVVAYRSAAECVEKVRYLLDHPDEARAMAERGRQRTLRDHTVAKRIERMAELFQQRRR